MRARLRTLVLGGSGQIGSELCKVFSGIAEVTSPSRAELDCSRLGDVAAYVNTFRPEWIINAAAFTNVDAAETQRELAMALNAALPDCLARSAAEYGGAVIQLSTDYVFSGASQRPYRESDEVGPLNWYGETKLAGEEAVLEAAEHAIVLRTSWIYSHAGHNFLRTMLRLAREREQIRVVADQFGAPTWARDVALAVRDIVAHLDSNGDAWTRLRGVYHVTAGGMTTWHGFASTLLQSDPRRSEQIVRDVVPIATASYPTPARRPPYSVLDCDLVWQRFGIRIPSWEAQLAAFWAA